MMTALLISLNLISITLYKEILSKAKLTIDLHCVGAHSSFRLNPSHRIRYIINLDQNSDKTNFLFQNLLNVYDYSSSLSSSWSSNGLKSSLTWQPKVFVVDTCVGRAVTIWKWNMQIWKCTPMYISLYANHHCSPWSKIDFKFHQTHCLHPLPRTTMTTIRTQLQTIETAKLDTFQNFPKGKRNTLNSCGYICNDY